jgi:hypothetical protein
MQHIPNKTRAFIDWFTQRFAHALPWNSGGRESTGEAAVAD